MGLRKADEKDITLIQKLAQSSWRSAYPSIIPVEQIEYMLKSMYSHDEICNHMKNSDFHYFIIENNKQEPVGFIGFEHYFEADTTKLHRIYLTQDAIGHGFGKEAINLVKDHTLSTLNKRIVLNVNKYNPALKVYQSQGFHIIDEIVLDIGNGYVMDDYIMEYIF